MERYTRKFNELNIGDVALVGGKNASLGEMYNQLSAKGIQVPNGFATTAAAFWHFIDSNNLRKSLEQLFSRLDKTSFTNLKEVGTIARNLLYNAKMPTDLEAEIINAYKELQASGVSEVAVRSSATAEDLPQASFAGQHESYLNVKGEADVVKAVQRCFASLYTDRAIKYREDNGFDYTKIALSAGVQRMVRADKACSGVCFTLEPESGFRNVIHIAGVWGLGENIVQGTVSPDEFLVFKPSLKAGWKAIIQKRLGDKKLTMIYAENAAISAVNTASTVNIDTPLYLRSTFVLSDEEITKLATWAQAIEEHYKMPMDIEWAKDGLTNELLIVQARPETVHSQKDRLHISEYTLLEKGEEIAKGEAIGSKIASG
ncbi:MAG: phosphoenolpyruvate synthase, partial [Bacteroidetes bacterium]|nr:phosphoenolpyruvate synthase [Bacteroidota bacterium]